jgi:uncharacterized FAD-dependent dehydrogenase
MRVFHNITVGLDEELEEKLAWMMPGYASHRILKKSVDARQRHSPHFVYSVEAYSEGESQPERHFKIEKVKYTGPRPIIIGAGPAGLFAALRFVERGVPCLLLERGSVAEKRMRHINRFWRYGELDPENNVCFGEGGAGLYSDGKLITRIKSPHISYVMNRLVQFGAPGEIEYLANPHVGSDRIRRVIPRMRQYLIENGCEIRFDSPVTRFLMSSTTEGQQIVGVETKDGLQHHSDKVILATGHSASDIFDQLRESNVHMEGKSFAVGLRIEHPQKLINEIQFREQQTNEKLGAANYRLAHHDAMSDMGVYSFCMCPGGYVLSSGTEANSVVCNGMSNYNRNSAFANSAIVVTVDYEKSFGRNNLWAGLEFRRALETKAYDMVKSKEIPAQRLVDFLNDKTGPTVASSSPSHVKAAPLHELMPANLTEHFKKGIEDFGRKMRGFISNEAQLHGVESRTSCPIRVTRDRDTLESLSHKGLYPCGEGAGYAGGITSAACDGIRIADVILGFKEAPKAAPEARASAGPKVSAAAKTPGKPKLSPERRSANL